MQWVGEFIRLYTTRNDRWLSPKFLAGESYGTTRAAALSEHLLDAQGIALNGIVFISTVLNFQTLSPGDGNDLPYALYLPSYAATAAWHKKLSADLRADLPKTLKEVEQWALTDYLAAPGQGGRRWARRSGRRRCRSSPATPALPPDVVDKANLRIDPGLFRAEAAGRPAQGDRPVRRPDRRLQPRPAVAARPNSTPASTPTSPPTPARSTTTSAGRSSTRATCTTRR